MVFLPALHLDALPPRFTRRWGQWEERGRDAESRNQNKHGDSRVRRSLSAGVELKDVRTARTESEKRR